jgi:hypothetical protein
LQLLAAILGPAYPIHVIDVEHQEELDGWTCRIWWNTGKIRAVRVEM